MTMTAQAAPQLPPVTVDCTACGSQFLSRARRHARVRCPHCGHSVRVKRLPGDAQAAVPAAAPTQPRQPTQPPPMLLPAPSRPPALPMPPRPLGARPAARPGAPARPPEPPPPAGPGRPDLTWADALAGLGWRLWPGTSTCQVQEGYLACLQRQARHITGGWVCGRHYAELAAYITGSTRP